MLHESVTAGSLRLSSPIFAVSAAAAYWRILMTRSWYVPDLHCVMNLLSDPIWMGVTDVASGNQDI